MQEVDAGQRGVTVEVEVDMMMPEVDAGEGRVMQEADADPRRVTVLDAGDGLRMSLQLQSPGTRGAGGDAAVPRMETARVKVQEDKRPGQTIPH